MIDQPTVFVGLSGGVDSSVAAARLIDQGYNVVGVFIKVWHPDWMVCNWEQERLDAMRVAAHLDIPFLTCDAEQAYKNDVADYFIAEYQAGRTPNPDVMCNQHVKFGRFLDFATEKGADYIATGHYAQKIDNKLHRGVDTGKDQTYFLWTLSKERLGKSLFPVGDTPKEGIRKEAEQRGIPVATKKDSQYPSKRKLRVMVWLDCAGACTHALTRLTNISSPSTRLDCGLSNTNTDAAKSAIISGPGGKRP